MSKEETAESCKSFLVGTKKDLIEAKRTSFTVDDRNLAIFYHQGVFYALDQQCYREYFLFWNLFSLYSKFPLADMRHDLYSYSLSEMTMV